MYEQICGARMTTNMGRIGGFERDFTPKFHELLKDWLKTSRKDWAILYTNERNRIFMDRTIGAGAYFSRKSFKL
jgi:NADH-quinone oxidoreductase subunit D